MLLRCVIHCHSEYSRDSAWKIADIITACKQQNINCIALTDHDTIAGAKALQAIAPDWLQVIIGEEISTQQGDLIGLFLRAKIEPRLSIETTIEQIHQQGGIALLPHPFDRLRTKAVGLAIADRVKDTIDLIETFNARCILSQDNTQAVNFARQYSLSAIAAADAHFPTELTNAICLLEDCTSAAALLKSVKNVQTIPHRASIVVHFQSALVKFQHTITKFYARIKKYSQLYNILGLSIITIIFFRQAFMLTSNYAAISPVNWMNIYSITDFTNWSQIWAYLKNLRTGIPPLVSFIEIISYWLTGTNDFIRYTVYQYSIIGAFLLSILFGSRSILLRVGSLIISSLFLKSFIAIHAGNPQLYDIIYPLCILLYVACLMMINTIQQRKLIGLLAIIAGLAVTTLELSRPFVIVFLPLMLIGGYWALRQYGRRYVLLFLLPVVLLSGSWHLKLLVLNNGQIIWSNHTGYNLMRAWNDTASVPLPLPDQVEENTTPLFPDRWQNLNTNEHYINSNNMKAAVTDFMIHNPSITLQFLDKRIRSFLLPKIIINGYNPAYVDNLYVVAVHFTVLWVVAGFFGILYWCWQNKSLRLLLDPTSLWIILTIGSIILLSIGEAGEEARLVLSIVPLLSGLPVPRLFTNSK